MLDPYSLAQKKWKKKVALLLGYRAMLNHAAFLHTGNADEVRLIEPLRLAPPCRTIPNGVFLEELLPLPPAGSFYAKHPEVDRQPFILFLARLHHKKGLDYLADAFKFTAAKMPDVRLVVAGPDGGARQMFVDRIASAGLLARVHVVGPLYHRDRLDAMADASCFCLPSRQEGFSLAITEALGCGLPVVISQNCHFPEVADFGAGLVLPLEAPALAEGLLSVLGDPGLRERMSRAGSKMIRERYTWPVIARQTIDAYNEFLR
jgi:glycosyltransferase involved in cell wall biosynthesis